MKISCGAVAAIGNFDGVHIGHQKLLSSALQYATLNDQKPIVVTFDKHTTSLINPNWVIQELYPKDENCILLENLGFSECHILAFDKEMMQMTAEDFLIYLRDTFSVLTVFMGSNSKFGSDRIGPSNLQNIAQLNGINLFIEELLFTGDQEVVSSTLIRKLLSEGYIHRANQLLGRPYTVQGRIVSGQGKGRCIGYPTLNLDLLFSSPLKPGVYEVLVRDQSVIRKGIANFGYAPTLANRSYPILEVHLLDGECLLLNNTCISVEIISFIRPEKKFNSVEALVNQIQQDIACLR